ncbi:hypothetical protein Dimus_002012 [Dionaea muscipula]
MSRSDLALVFSSSSAAAAATLSRVVEEETEWFLKLVEFYAGLNNGTIRDSAGGHGLAPYLRIEKQREGGEGTKKKEKETIWGKGTRPTTRGNQSELEELTRASYGSVVGFTDSELDPENSLSGFLDHVPMSLRRWACYPMLLGRVKRNFKHLMLVDVKEMIVVGDPFTRVRNRGSESVLLWSSPEPDPGKRGRRSAAKPGREQKPADPGIIVGGSRGVRRVAAGALMGIVRVAVEHKGKGKNSVTESGIVNQLVRNPYFLKSVDVVVSPPPLVEVPRVALNSVVGTSRGSFVSNHSGLVRRGHNRNFDVDIVLLAEICSYQVYSSVYSDCAAAVQ